MKRITLFIMCLFFASALWAQNLQISGVVTDAADGQPLPGAVVLVVGTKTTTITDADGRYTISAPATASLEFSSMNMKTVVVPVNGRNVVNVAMEADTKELEEIVVTAMGITRSEKALGYSVQKLKSEELTQAGNTSFAGALQGKTAGIDIKSSSGMPGSSSQIVIRGARSFTGNNTPLYVIDGMPVASTADYSTGYSVSGTDLANRGVDFDPNDIESINILKGQAASALYGIRASNGVIVITTKSGKGLGQGKAHVTFSSSVTADVISRTPELQTTYAQGSNGNYSYNSSTSWGPKIVDLPKSTATVSGIVVGGDGRGHDGMYYVRQRDLAGLDPWVKPQVYDNITNFFNTGMTYNNSLNVSQAKDNVNYAFSLGATNQEGVIPGTGMDRYNAKVSTENKFNEHWKTGFIANYVSTAIEKQTSANGGLVATVYPAPPSYDLVGIPSHIKDDPYTQNAYRSTSGFDNAPWSVDNNQFTEKTDRVYGNIYGEFTTKLNTSNHKLVVRYQAGIDAYTTHYQSIYGYGHFNGRGSINNYGISRTIFNSLLSANYQWQINDELDLTVVLGNEFDNQNSKSYDDYGQNYNFPGWSHMNNTTVQSSAEAQSQNRTVGFFGNIALNYKSMLFLNITGRNDVVSTMPRDSRSFFYPSVALGFVFTELDIFKNNSILTFGKLRASYAEVGQAGSYYEAYYSLPTYGGGFWMSAPITYPINSVKSFVPGTTIYDPNLKPQNTRSYELGVDLNFFSSLIFLNYTYSRQNVKDQIFAVPLAGSTGDGAFVTNAGRLHTDAHEITLGINPIRTKIVDWNIGFNFSKIDNYVDELAPGVESIMLGGFVTPQIRAGIKDKYPVIYGSSFKRDDKGRILVNAAGMPIAGPDAVIGSVSPDFILGANTSLKLWDLTVSAVLEWKQGGHMYGGTPNLLNMYGVGKETETREGTIVFDGYKADGSKNDIPITGVVAQQNYYNTINGIGEGSVYGNSFVKLREVALSYPVLKTSWLSLIVNAYARNILLWTEFPYIDPESTQGNNNMSGGFERFSLPQTTSFGGGIVVKF